MKYSIIIPCYKSENTIESVVRLINEEMKFNEIKDYEIILINDDSPDKILNVLRMLSEQYKFVKVINLSRNFGQANAIMAGLNYATGDYIINLDDDLQTHPSQMIKLMNKIDEGYDIVVAKYKHKKHNVFRNILTKIGDLYSVNCMGREKNLKFTSYWIITKNIKDEIINYTYPFSYMEGLFLRTTSSIVNVEVEHFARKVGKSGYSIKKIFMFFLNSTNFTIIPLRLATILGFCIAIVGFIGVCTVIINKFVHPDVLPGWSSVMSAICVLSGAILICMGILGEYIGRIFMCINKAPQFVVKEKINFEQQKKKERL